MCNYVSSSMSNHIHQASCDDTKFRRTRQGQAMEEYERNFLYCARMLFPWTYVHARRFTRAQHVVCFSSLLGHRAMARQGKEAMFALLTTPLY